MNLIRYPLLHDAHNFWPQFLDRAFPQGASAPTKNIRFNQTSLAIEAAIASQGLALTSLFFVEDDLASGRLVRLFSTELRVGSDFYAVSPRKPRHPASVGLVVLVVRVRSVTPSRVSSCLIILLIADHKVVATGRNTEKVIKAIRESENLLVVKLDVTSAADAIDIAEQKIASLQQQVEAHRELSNCLPSTKSARWRLRLHGKITTDDANGRYPALAG